MANFINSTKGNTLIHRPVKGEWIIPQGIEADGMIFDIPDFDDSDVEEVEVFAEISLGSTMLPEWIEKDLSTKVEVIEEDGIYEVCIATKDMMAAKYAIYRLSGIKERGDVMIQFRKTVR